MAIGPDPTYSGQSKIYIKQQPEKVTLNGGTVTTEEVSDTGSLQNRYGISAVNGKIQADQALISAAAGAATHSVVTIVLADNNGNAITGQPFDCDVILSDAANGVGVTATTPSGGVSVTTGTLLNTYIASKAFYIQSDATGTIVINITDASKTGFYIMVQGVSLPFAYVSAQLTAGSYG